MREHTPFDPHVLYRFYDTADQLLYVGITADPGARWREHRRKREWWTDVARIALENHPNRGAALDAERRAIAEEEPLLNVLRPDPNKAPAFPVAEPSGWRPVYAMDAIISSDVQRNLKALIESDPFYQAMFAPEIAAQEA